MPNSLWPARAAWVRIPLPALFFHVSCWCLGTMHIVQLVLRHTHFHNLKKKHVWSLGDAVPRRLSKTEIASIFFTLTLAVSIIGIIEMQSVYHSSYIIYASILSEKPNGYFVLEDPDAYVLEAMLSQNYVNIGSPEDTQIDDLIRAKETSYFECNGTYYAAGFEFETKYPPALPFALILIAAATSASSLGAIASSIAINRTRNRSRKAN